MIQRAIDRGEIRKQAEAARKLGVTRARITQMLDLTFLAPELQEEILLAQSCNSLDGNKLTERTSRRMLRLSDWTRQRRARWRCGPHGERRKT
jgi:hypothetical protein